MKAGDIFLCTQRCAYLHSINNGDSLSTIIYFRVSHVDHAILKHSSLDSIWVEYKSASYYLESSEEVYYILHYNYVNILNNSLYLFIKIL